MNNFTNLDARYLYDLVTDIEDDETQARLLRIAENLQRMDERNAILASKSSYADGIRDAELRMKRRSNILNNPEGESEAGSAIIDQIDRAVAQGKVRRIPYGERALEDKPDTFNGRKVRPPTQAAKQPVPAITLDLDFLGDL